MKTSYLLLCLLFVSTTHAQIQIVDTAPGTNQVALSGSYTQNFDSLTGTGSGRPWTDNVTLPGWYITASAYGLGFGGGEGISSMGYVGGQGDRALGPVGSISHDELIAVSFKNLTSSTLTSVSVAFDGEQWNRQAANPQKPSSLLFSYQIFEAGTGAIYIVENTGWTFVPSLGFTSPNASLNASSTLDGNDPANSVRGFVSFVNGFTLAPGQELWLSWGSYSALGVPIHGLGIDNLSVSFATVPEPASYAALVGGLVLGLVALRRRRSAR
jgi:hypothetical protein